MGRKLIISLLLAIAPLCSAFGQWIQSTDSVGFIENQAGFLQLGSYLYAYDIYMYDGSHGVLSSKDNGESWTHVMIDSSSIAGNRIMATQEGNLYSTWEDCQVRNDSLIDDTLFTYLSTDTGRSWSKKQALMPSMKIGNGVTGSITLATCGSNLILGRSNGIFISRDSGASWLNTLVTDTSVYRFTVTRNIVYAGGVEGLFWSRDSGLTWSMRDSGIELSPNYNTLLTSRGDTLFSGWGISTDSGLTWNYVSFGSSSIFVYRQYLFTASSNSSNTTRSLLVSSDDGETWKNISGPFGPAVCCIVSGPNIVVGTDGVWYAPLASLGISSVAPMPSGDNGVSVYPNPTLGPVTVRGATTDERTSAGAVTITNVLGEDVANSGNRVPTSGEIQIDLSKLPAGTYIARIEMAGGIVVRKIIKE